MKTAIALMALIWMTMSGAARAEVIETETIQSTLLRKTVAYTVYQPPGYDRGTRAYPVIYLMHGGGAGRFTDWFRLGKADKVFDGLIEDGTVPPFIAITPDGRRDPDNRFNTYYMNDADGGYRWQDMFVREFIPTIEKRYRIVSDKDSRGILGLSMGGYAAVVLSLKYPDLFAGAAAISAAFRTDAQITDMDQKGYDTRYGKAWGVGLQGKARLNTLFATNDVLHLLDRTSTENIEKTPFYIDCGSNDSFFDGNAIVHQKLRKLGISHRFMVREGAHDWNYWRSGLPGATIFIGPIFQK